MALAPQNRPNESRPAPFGVPEPDRTSRFAPSPNTKKWRLTAIPAA